MSRVDKEQEEEEKMSLASFVKENTFIETEIGERYDILHAKQ
jgi:hypothetical protein